MKQDDLKLVLDALKWCHGGEPCGTAQAIAVVEEALAQPEHDYERGFVDGMQKQMQSSVDKAVNRMAQEKALQALHSENERLGLYKDAYAQPEQEPSGHFLDFAYSDSIAYVHVYDQFRKGQQFYKAPPQRTWVGLTDVEIDYLLGSTVGENEETHIAFARAIEAKLKERNT
jgi:hypothetical protein